MDSRYILTSNGELYHWGVKGMHWGVRRYQNKDGSLTPRGEKRRARLEGKLEKVTGGSGGSGGSTRKKSINELTDDELRAATNRMNLERDYHNAKKGLDAANPPKESREKRGQKFVSNLMNEVVAPAAKNAGKAWLEQTLKDRLGVDAKSKLERIKEEYEVLDYKKKISDLKEPKKSTQDYVKTLANMSDDEVALLSRVAGVQYYMNAIESGKGSKPDKGNNNKKKDDD